MVAGLNLSLAPVSGVAVDQKGTVQWPPMYLTLEVVSENGAALGRNRRKVIGPEGGLIGRAKENDWVIEDPHVSRQNARVRYVNGAFYIEGLGKNLLGMNAPTRLVPNHEPQILRTGDTVFIDQFEVKVSISAAAPADALLGARPPNRHVEVEDPFGEVAASASWSPSSLGRRDLGERRGHARSARGNRWQVAPPQPELPPANWQQSSPLSDSYQAPAVHAPMYATPPKSAGGSAIPDQWDLSPLRPCGGSEACPQRTHAGGSEPRVPPPTRSAAPPPVRQTPRVPSSASVQKETRAAPPTRPMETPSPRPEPNSESASARAAAGGHTCRGRINRPR